MLTTTKLQTRSEAGSKAKLQAGSKAGSKQKSSN
jgi:hypothetical protein